MQIWHSSAFRLFQFKNDPDLANGRQHATAKTSQTG
jgi:hypothetical protein